MLPYSDCSHRFPLDIIVFTTFHLFFINSIKDAELKLSGMEDRISFFALLKFISQ